MQEHGREENEQEEEEMEEEDDADYGEEEDPEGNPDEDGEDDEEGDGLGGHAKMVAFHAAIKAVLTRQLEKMGQEVEASLYRVSLKKRSLTRLAPKVLNKAPRRSMRMKISPKHCKIFSTCDLGTKTL